MQGASQEFEEVVPDLLSLVGDLLYVADEKQDIMLVDSYKGLVVAVVAFVVVVV